MQALEAQLKRLARRRRARWWVGDTPDVRIGQLPSTIAAKVRYPESTSDPFACGAMVALNRSQAAHVLAVAGATSLAYGDYTPPKGIVRETTEALRCLADGAVFISNGLWEATASSGWMPLTSATFDCGLIGYDERHAFIFWVEEED